MKSVRTVSAPPPYRVAAIHLIMHSSATFRSTSSLAKDGAASPRFCDICLLVGYEPTIEFEL